MVVLAGIAIVTIEAFTVLVVVCPLVVIVTAYAGAVLFEL